MKAYVDSSVILRIVLAAPHSLVEWTRIGVGLTSELLRVECCRTLDRLARSGEITDDEYAAKLAALQGRRIWDEIAPLFATHDHTLTTAARASGFDVIGTN